MPPEKFILGYLILNLKRVIITGSVILEISIMIKALSFQNISGAGKKVV